MNQFKDALKIKKHTKGEQNPEGISHFYFIRLAESNYVAMRVLVLFGDSLFPENIAHNGAECLEKIMKAFLILRGGASIKQIKSYRHNLNGILKDCKKIDNFFDCEDLSEFCDEYEKGKGNEVLRYGLGEEIKGVSFDLFKIIPLVDKFFLGTLLRLDDMNFYASGGFILSIVTPNVFSEVVAKNLSSPRSFEIIKEAIWRQNFSLPDFIKKIENFHKTINFSPPSLRRRGSGGG